MTDHRKVTACNEAPRTTTTTTTRTNPTTPTKATRQTSAALPPKEADVTTDKDTTTTKKQRNNKKRIIHQIVEEKTYVPLRCPHSVEGDVTWSRERNGDTVNILTVSGGRNVKHIDDPGRRYLLLADKSLFILKPVVSDSGRYFCNNEAVKDLTVIPSGTTIVPAPERTSITLTCPHDVGASHVPTWTRDSGGIQPRRFDVSPVDQTLTITDVQPGDSGLYYCDGRPAVYLNVIEAILPETPYPWQMCVRTVIGILYLIIMISITVTTWRKARQTEATHSRNRK
ncbi:uncharacterized protein LOC114568525 [Perca flavescens]|uniref:uncharacterized protein LOC114568525 n=1 Tax=Perca flavescens TaxID=8167 RepID=UPI00106E86D1|nr:uncharacterized protein LOC114568525 [Perca flavescens]